MHIVREEDLLSRGNAFEEFEEFTLAVANQISQARVDYAALSTDNDEPCALSESGNVLAL